MLTILSSASPFFLPADYPIPVHFPVPGAVSLTSPFYYNPVILLFPRALFCQISPLPMAGRNDIEGFVRSETTERSTFPDNHQFFLQNFRYGCNIPPEVCIFVSGLGFSTRLGVGLRSSSGSFSFIFPRSGKGPAGHIYGSAPAK